MHDNTFPFPPLKFEVALRGYRDALADALSAAIWRTRMIYYSFTGSEDFDLLKVQVFLTSGPPTAVEATLHWVGSKPPPEGLEISGRIGSVVASLEDAQVLSLRHAVPYRVELDGVDWDQRWGRITQAPDARGIRPPPRRRE